VLGVFLPVVVEQPPHILYAAPTALIQTEVAVQLRDTMVSKVNGVFDLAIVDSIAYADVHAAAPSSIAHLLGAG
jgi:hypothetical protein